MVGTLKPVENFNPEVDCNLLKAAFSGVGTDEKTLIDVLCKRSIDQRMEISKLYKVGSKT